MSVVSVVGGRRGRVRSLCMSTNLLEYEYKSAEKEGRRESSAESLSLTRVVKSEFEIIAS